MRLRSILWAPEIQRTPSFSLGASQEEKQALRKGVVHVDSEPDIPTRKVQVLNCDVEDVLTRDIMSSTHCISTPLSRVLILVVSRLSFSCWLTEVNDIMVLHYF